MTNVAEKKKRRPAPATTPSDERSHLIDLWLGLYTSDPDFRDGTADRTGIERFADSQAVAVEQIVGTYGDENAAGHVSWARLNAGMPAFAEYVGKVESFAAEWHLHLLGERGYEAVHDYCLARFHHGTQPEHFDAARASRLRSPRPILDPRITLSLDPSSEQTGNAVAVGRWVPEWDSDDEESQKDSEGPLRWTFREAVQRPVPEEQLKASRAARVGTSPTWNPILESMRDAKARILKDFENQLDAELQRIAAEHERAGFDFTDTSPELRRHLWWTYQQVVKEIPTAIIYAGDAEQRIAAAKSDGCDDQEIKTIQPRTVGNAIATMRERLGLPVAES